MSTLYGRIKILAELETEKLLDIFEDPVEQATYALHQIQTLLVEAERERLGLVFKVEEADEELQANSELIQKWEDRADRHAENKRLESVKSCLKQAKLAREARPSLKKNLVKQQGKQKALEESMAILHRQSELITEFIASFEVNGHILALDEQSVDASRFETQQEEWLEDQLKELDESAVRLEILGLTNPDETWEDPDDELEEEAQALIAQFS